MQLIAYYISIPFIYLLLLIPFSFFYLLSDLVFVFLYYLVGYRRQVVRQNLKNAFPDKNEKELKKISRKFYRYLCDLFLETFKTLTISKEAMLNHCRMNEEGIKLLQKYYDYKKSVILVLGHLGNWEWGGNTFSLQCRHPLFVIYHPLENKYFNKMVIGMRTRFGTKLIEMKNTFREMVKMKNKINATAFIADQTPPPANAYWTTFLNQDTPVFKGTEVVAKKLNYPVVFINVKKTKRGHYELTAETLCENPSSTSEGEISELHTKKLESEIIKNPETWLWSHRRWKHKRPMKN